MSDDPTHHYTDTRDGHLIACHLERGGKVVFVDRPDDEPTMSADSFRSLVWTNQAYRLIPLTYEELHP